MGGTVISVLGGVLPFKANFIFFVLVAVVGYGIYLPYQEKKKYGPSQHKTKKQSVPKAEHGLTSRKIGTLLLCALLGSLLLWMLGFFLMSLIFAPLIGGIAAVVLVVFGGLMVILLGALLWRAARSMGQGHRKKAERPSPASAPKRTSEQHDHLPSVAPSVQERLEQLKALKEAGLMDNAEYEQRKKTILEGK